MRYRLAALTSHPIQYQAPLFRALARRPEVDLTVLFCSDFGVQPSADPGFGKVIRYDVPLTEGYAHRFLKNVSPRPGPARFEGEVNLEIAPLLLRERFDALWVHGYAHATSWLAFAAARATSTPLLLRGESTLLYERTFVLRAAKRAVLTPLVRGAAACLYVGEENRRFYLHYGAREDRLFFAPYSVENGFFRARADAAAEAAQAIRARLGATPQRPLALFAGKLVARKRPRDFIDAAARIGERMVFALVGEGEERAELESRAPGHVHFIGFANQSEMPAWYAAADVLVLPSEYETWGLVVNEAMACGTPAVVSHLCGCARDLVREGESGLVFPCGDAAALAAALERFLDPALRERCRRGAAEVVARYDVERTADGVVAALQAVAR
jgi:glycosyltransferase involved in cell wall biosynthesis